jgi:hypothetical protein
MQCPAVAKSKASETDGGPRRFSRLAVAKISLEGAVDRYAPYKGGRADGEPPYCPVMVPCGLIWLSATGATLDYHKPIAPASADTQRAARSNSPTTRLPTTTIELIRSRGDIYNRSPASCVVWVAVGEGGLSGQFVEIAPMNMPE